MDRASACCIVLVTLLIQAAARCPNDWVRHEDSCYVFIDENVPWTSAAVICKVVLGAQLLEIDSDIENDFVKGQIFARNNIENIWLGLTDFTREGRWTLVSTKEEPAYTKWAPGEPDNLSPQERGQDCAYIRADGTWDDEACDHNVVVHAVACEVRDVESPVVG